MLRRALVAMVMSAVLAPALRAQAPTGDTVRTASTARYTPERGKHRGRELVAVVIGSSGCPFSTSAPFIQAVDPMLRALQAQADVRGLSFAAIAVAVDAEPDSGFAYFRRVARFDEVIAGRTWFGSGLLFYATPAYVSKQMTPSLVVLERELVDAPRHTTAQPARVLVSLVGLDSVLAFARRGARLDAVPDTARPRARSAPRPG